MFRIAPTYNSHPLPGFTRERSTITLGAAMATHIPGTDYMLCIDPTHSSLILMQLRGKGAEDIYDLPPEWIPADTILQRLYFTSLPIPDARCAGMCVDHSGARIFLLMLAPPRSFIKIIRLENGLTLREYPEETYELPYDSLPMFPAYITDPTTGMPGLVPLLDITHRMGSACYVNKYLAGAGIVYHAGKLFILTRRQISLEIPLAHPWLADLDVRRISPQFSLLMQVDAITMAVEGACQLSQPGLGVRNGLDAVFNGLTLEQNFLYLGRRLDKQVIPSDSSLWGIQEKWVERGEASLVALPLPAEGADWRSSMPLIPFYGSLIQHVTDGYPFDLALPSSLSIDQSRRKLYAVFGNCALLFDMLPFTILVNYGSGTALFAGEIIDFGYLKDSTQKTLTCYLKNDSSERLSNIRLQIFLKKEAPRREDVFLAASTHAEGVRQLNLGTLLPGQSAAFEVRVSVTEIGVHEEYATVRVPLRVKYNLDP